MLCVASLNAATFTVTTVLDEFDFPSGVNLSLREALRDASAAAGDDTVVFADALSGQTLLLNGQIALNLNSVDRVTVDASSLPSALTVSGGGTCRLFSVTGSNGALSLVKLILTSGNGAGGGVNGTGGAILLNVVTLSLDRCTLINNATNVGGAVMNNGGRVIADDCTFAANRSETGQGGAIYQGASGSLMAQRCSFTGNSSVDNGGALYSSGTANLTQCSFVGNSGMSGGAVFNAMNSSLVINHCTITNNNSQNSAGGITCSYASLTLANSIVAGNNSLSGSAMDISNFGNSPFGASTVTRIGANLVQSSANNGNLASDTGPEAISLAPLLSPLGHYGGLTQTVALLPGSPARENSIGSSMTSDQRGLPIVGTPDLGAYESGTITNFENFIWETLPATATTLQHASNFDYDGDGQSNEAEWIAFTDPVDPSSRFAAIAQRHGASLTITVPTALGRVYNLKESATMSSNSWTSVNGSLSEFGTGSPIIFSIPMIGEGRFYQVQVSLP